MRNAPVLKKTASSNNDIDLDLVIASLERALFVVEYRIADAAAECSRLARGKIALKESLVAASLPDISALSYSRLKERFPGLCGHPGMEDFHGIFERHRRVFGFFKTSGYDAALASLRARLSTYMENDDHSWARAFHVDIDEDDRVLADLYSRRTNIVTAIDSLQQLQCIGAPLQELVRESVTSMADAARDIEARSSLKKNTAAKEGASLGRHLAEIAALGDDLAEEGEIGVAVQTYYQVDDSADLWMNLLQHAPDSFREALQIQMALGFLTPVPAKQETTTTNASVEAIEKRPN